MNMDQHNQDGASRESDQERADRTAIDEVQNGAGDSGAEVTETAEEKSFTEQAEEALDDLPEWAAEKLESFEGEDTREDAEVQTAEAQSAQEAAPEGSKPPAGSDNVSEAPHDDTATKTAPNLDLMLDLPLDVNVELGRAELPLAQVLELKAGSVIQLDRLPGEPLDLYVNDQLVAKGEIVVLNETFAFRITDLVES